MGLTEVHTVGEVSALTGVSISTLKRWHYTGTGPGPSQSTKLGGLCVNLYTAEDVALVMAFKGTLKPGRPRKEQQ